MKYYLKNEFLQVETDTLGAELTSVTAYGKERLWQNGDGSWSGHAPHLFPSCGNCAMRVEGKLYPLPRHGFARKKQFRVTEQGEDHIRFTLSADEETLAGYPFRFTFSVGYRLEKNSILVQITVLNTDSKEIAFSYGGHESFALTAGEEYFLQFPQEEKFINLLHNDDGILIGASKDLGQGSKFVIKSEYFKKGYTVIFHGLNSKSVTLKKADGTPIATTEFEGYPNLLLWRPENADMICIEPWLTLPDEENDGRDITEKGFYKLSPGNVFSSERKITYYEI